MKFFKKFTKEETTTLVPPTTSQNSSNQSNNMEERIDTRAIVSGRAVDGRGRSLTASPASAPVSGVDNLFPSQGPSRSIDPPEFSGIPSYPQESPPLVVDTEGIVIYKLGQDVHVEKLTQEVLMKLVNLFGKDCFMDELPSENANNWDRKVLIVKGRISVPSIKVVYSLD